MALKYVIKIILKSALKLLEAHVHVEARAEVICVQSGSEALLPHSGPRADVQFPKY